MKIRLLLAGLLLVASCKFKTDRVIRPGEIRGKAVFELTDGTKIPAANSTVQLMGSNIKLRTDATGEFLFRNMPAGSYTLRTTYQFGQSEDDIAGLMVPRVTLQPSDGSAAHLGTMVLLRLAAVEGVVTINSEIAPNAKVVLDGYGQQISDSVGHYLFEGVYPISPYAADKAIKLSAIAKNGDLEGLGKSTFEPKMGVRSDVGVKVDIPLDTVAPTTVTGTAACSGEPQEMTAYAIPEDGGDPIPVKVNADGTYAIENLPAGVYTFEVSAPGYQTVSLPLTVVAGEPVQLSSVILTKADATCGFGGDVADSDGDGIGDLCDPDPGTPGTLFCGTNPCRNHGVCSEGATTFVCTCVAGFSGVTCEAPPAAKAPDAPTNASAVAGDGEAVVSWTAPANHGGTPITGYVVTSTPGGLTATTVGTSVTVTGLTNGTAYAFTVRARNAKGDSPESAASNPVTPQAGLVITAPDAPTSVVAEPGDTQAIVTWTAPASDGGAPITGYVVTSTPGGKTASTSSATMAVVTGLTNGTSYTFTVRAKNAKGDSPESAPSSAVTPASGGTITTPDRPTNVVAHAENGTAQVTWSPPPSNGGSPIVEYVVTSSPGGIVVKVLGNVHEANFTGLTNGVTYQFLVAARNARGESLPATSNSVVPSTSTDAPTNVQVTPSRGKAAVSWDPPANDGGSPVTGYTVSVFPGGMTQSTSATSITITGLTNGLEYSFIVTANNFHGPGGSATSLPAKIGGAPSEPYNVQPYPTSGQVKVYWERPADDGGFPVSGYVVTVNPGNLQQTVAASPATLTGLTAGVEYTVSVAATNAIGTGPASSLIQFTLADVPDAPTNVYAVAGVGEAAVYWDPPASDGGAPIQSYTVIANPGGLAWTTTGTAFSFPGLTIGVTYIFRVFATNSAGDSPYSIDSNPVTPQFPPRTYVITNPQGTGPGSLYQAFLSANASPGLDFISFAGLPPGMPVTFGNLPELTDPIVIDGSSIPGFSGTNLVSFDTGLRLTGAGATLRYVNVQSLTGVTMADCQSCVVDHVDASWTQGGTGGSGIVITNSIGATITHNSVVARALGIAVDGATDIIIKDNDLTDAGDCSYNAQWGNAHAFGAMNVFSQALPGGIAVSGNHFGGSTACGASFRFMQDLHISNAAGAGVNVVFEPANGFGSATEQALFLQYVRNLSVTNLDVAGIETAGYGMFLDSCTNATIVGNNARNRCGGFLVWHPTDLTVQDNDLSGSGSCPNYYYALQIVSPTQVNIPGGVSVSGNLFDDLNNFGVLLNGLHGVKISGVPGPDVNILLERSKGFGTSSSNPLNVEYSSDIIIDRLDVSSSELVSGMAGIGIVLQNNTRVTVQSSLARFRSVGLSVSGGQDITLVDNDLANSGSCFYGDSALMLSSVQPGVTASGVSVSGTIFGGGGCEVALTSLQNLTVAGSGQADVVLERSKGFGSATYEALRLNACAHASVKNLDLTLNSGGPFGTGFVATNCDSLNLQGLVAANRDVGAYLDTASGTSTITCSRFEDSNRGLWLLNSSIAVHSSNFVGNSTGIYEYPGNATDATSNWWGAANGPSNLGGSGNSYEGLVDASNFLTSPAACVP